MKLKDKYDYYTYVDKNTNAKVVVVTTCYDGKLLKGVAKCASSDEYNEQTGINLALARCEYKVARQRIRRAENKREIATRDAYNMFNQYCRLLGKVSDARDYLEDAHKRYQIAEDKLYSLEDTLIYGKRD